MTTTSEKSTVKILKLFLMQTAHEKFLIKNCFQTFNWNSLLSVSKLFCNYMRIIIFIFVSQHYGTVFAYLLISFQFEAASNEIKTSVTSSIPHYQ